MTRIRHIDHGVVCDQEGCADTVYETQLDVKDTATLLKRLRRRGWSISVHAGDTAVDYCPKHSGRRRGR